MYSRIALRQLSLATRVSARSYTSSSKEGSVAASKEFGYVSSMNALSSPVLSKAILNRSFCSKREKANEGTYFFIIQGITLATEIEIMGLGNRSIHKE